MKSLNHYIIKVPEPYSETITTDGGVEIYLDKRFNARELANTEGEVIEIPALGKNCIPKGSKVIIDSTIFIEQSYRKVKQESTFLADKKEGLYRVDDSLIFMYQEPRSDEWKCNGKNLFVEPIEVEKKQKSSLIIEIDEVTQKYETGKARVAFTNDYLEKSDVQIGDTLFIKEERDIEYKLNGKTYWWIRNHDIIASEINPN